ncbi:hypothetical protein C0J52_17692 [Blattella germanica]|nr:hypothetical protein C0J52_17692 [Blattella germanica]
MDFLGILSKVSRGSVQEKLQWIFGLYDLNGDGLITKNEMLDVVTSIYEMLGRSTEPVVEEHSAKEHVEKIFHERFNMAPPRKATLLDWERRAFSFSSVKDRLRSERKKTREETCAGVLASIEQSPIKSTRNRAAELGIPRTTMRDHIKEDLKVRP